MANETPITIVGNLTADPELRFTPGGAAVANFTIASTPRTYDRNSNEWKDGEALFMRCAIWREQAENAAQSLSKGMRVVAVGNLKSRSYETKEGEKRTVIEMDVDEIGPALRYATAAVTRRPSGSAAPGQTSAHGGGGWGQPAANTGWGQPPRGNAPAAAQHDPWAQPTNPHPGAPAQPPAPRYDEPPF